MSWPHNSRDERERVFVIEVVDDLDAVARVLGLFAAQGCRLEHVALDRSGPTPRLRVHARGLDEDRADHLRLRLAALPVVQAVGLGWRALSARELAAGGA